MKKNTTCHRTLFLWKKEHFLSQEIYFLSHQINFLSQEIYFLWQEIIFLWQSCHWLQFCDDYCVDNVAIFPVVSGEIIYWKIRFPRNFKYYPTLGGISQEFVKNYQIKLCLNFVVFPEQLGKICIGTDFSCMQLNFWLDCTQLAADWNRSISNAF